MKLDESANSLRPFAWSLVCGWPDGISQWIRQRVCIKLCVDLGKIIAAVAQTVIRQAFEEESLSRTTGGFNGKFHIQWDRKR
jgi:hypothetical protein